jgi:hypothetical protein
VGSRNEIEHLQAEADYYHDRIALCEPSGTGMASVQTLACKRSNERLTAPEQRLRDARMRAKP